MKITVKNRQTEVVIEDGETKTDTNSNLIYYNQKYILELLEKIFKEIVLKTGFKIQKSSLCFTKPFDLLWAKIFKNHPFNDALFIKIDNLLGRFFSFNYSYHSKNTFQKIGSACIFFVLKK